MNTEQKSSGGKKGGVRIVIAVGAVVIAALVAVIVILLLPKKEKEKEEENRNVVVTEDNVEEVVEQMENAEPVEPGYYTVTMNNTWHFADGKAASEDAHVENIKENTNDVYFDIFLADDEKNAIYKSPVIPRGGKLEKITLDKDLDAGTHDCIMVYHLVDENQDTVSTLRVAVTLIIEK